MREHIGFAADIAGKISPALEKEYRLAKQETGERIGDRKLVEYKKTIGSDSLEHVRHLMNVNHIRHLPVIDNFALAGVISMRDVSSAFDEAAGCTAQTAA